MTRKILYNEKGYWKRKFKQLDRRVLQLLNFERSGAIEIALTDYVEQANECIDLGLTGELILDKLVKYGFPDRTIVDMRNMINLVEVFSRRLKDVAESKWQKELDSFPVFKSSTETVGVLLEKTKAIREMNAMLEEKNV